MPIPDNHQMAITHGEVVAFQNRIAELEAANADLAQKLADALEIVAADQAEKDAATAPVEANTVVEQQPQG